MLAKQVCQCYTRVVHWRPMPCRANAGSITTVRTRTMLLDCTVFWLISIDQSTSIPYTQLMCHNSTFRPPYGRPKSKITPFLCADSIFVIFNLFKKIQMLEMTKRLSAHKEIYFHSLSSVFTLYIEISTSSPIGHIGLHVETLSPHVMFQTTTPRHVSRDRMLHDPAQ